MEEEFLDFTKLKYVLYARKSTEDESRQIRSTGDQIAECRQLASRIGITVAEPPVIEEKSAKSPNNRPLFRQMLKDIRAGKYDGILAWNPDRLARNMLEGGEIIDMIDEGIIKDLKFVVFL
jgi:DNA invertase Pin-like site-specific DNA recombinase